MTSQKEIKISVVIPCYNCDSTIERAVFSVMAGSKLPFEILLYDDCSVDKTKDMIENIAIKFSLVKFFLGTDNKGAGYARRFLIEKATGDYIAFLDADDQWFAKKLDKILTVIHREEPDIITSFYEIEDEFNQKIGARALPHKINLFNMHFSNWLPMSMTVVRSSLAGVDEMPLIRRRQDYAFWLNIFKKNKSVKCHIIPEPLGIYTRRSGSLSSGTLTNIKFNYKMFRQVLKYDPFTAIFLVLSNGIVRFFRA